MGREQGCGEGGWGGEGRGEERREGWEGRGEKGRERGGEYRHFFLYTLSTDPKCLLDHVWSRETFTFDLKIYSVYLAVNLVKFPQVVLLRYRIYKLLAYHAYIHSETPEYKVYGS